MNRKDKKPRVDIYAKITDRIVADLEKNVRPWARPWSAANIAGRITRPLRAVRRLEQGEREALLLFAWAGLSYEEIAACQSIPVGTVRSRLSRARARLRDDLTSPAAGSAVAPIASEGALDV